MKKIMILAALLSFSFVGCAKISTIATLKEKVDSLAKATSELAKDKIVRDHDAKKAEDAKKARLERKNRNK
jgi:hypothetical protein